MNSNGKKILFVEDDQDFMDIMSKAFAGQGFTLLAAHDGAQGLAMAEKEQPDLILVDIGLPEMDGISMAKAIKEKKIPSQMIFLTNLKDAEHVSEAIDIAGGIDYIVKSDTHIGDVVARVKEKLGVQ